MSTIRQRTAVIREKRTGSIAAYAGTARALANEAVHGGLVQRVRTYTQDVASDLQRAFDLLRSIDGLALVVHGPAGCAAGPDFAGTQAGAICRSQSRSPSVEMQSSRL